MSTSRPARARPFSLRLAVGVIAVSVAVTACGNTAKSKQSSAAKLLQQGLTAQGAGNLDQARQDYLGVLKLDPNNKFAYYDLGVIYQQLGDVNSAADNYHKALNVDPNYNPALFNLAILETPIAPQTAIGLYRQILARNPNDANVHFNLGFVLQQVGQTADGDAEIAAAIRTNPALASRVPPTSPTVPPATTTTHR